METNLHLLLKHFTCPTLFDKTMNIFFQKKGKVKISKLKRNNHTTNKMKKQGALKLQRHRPKTQKQRQPTAPPSQDSDSDGSASGEEWEDMLDDAEKEYMLQRLSQQPQLLASVPKEDEPSQKFVYTYVNFAIL